MKKTLLIMVMAFALLFAQCRKPSIDFPTPSAADEGTTVSMTVTAGPGSKTDITTAGGITWSSGDKLYVGDGSKYVGYLTIVSGEGTPTGTFSGDVTLTGITEGTEKMFHFFYLGNAKDYSTELTKGTSTEVAVSFATQEIYNNSGNLENASKHHVGYGSAKGTVAGSEVTGINVTLVSKVALARFSFTESDSKGGAYTGALMLSGTGICNKMTVSFASSTGFSFTGTEGTIRLRGIHSERYVMLVPAGTDRKTLNFVGGASGRTTLENGIEANKFYGREVAIGVEVTPQYVDLGLPSGLLWATCNLGATNGETAESWYGDYYAWGETAGYGEAMVGDGANSGASYEPGTVKTDYVWDDYKWGSGSHTLGKYVDKPGFGMDEPDYKTVLDAEDDAAHVVWGGDWRMPTKDDFTELKGNTDRTWYVKGNTEFNGVAGWKCVNRLDATKYIFLPAAGHRDNKRWVNVGNRGYYWLSKLYSGYPYCAYAMDLDKDEFKLYEYQRVDGYAIRPVMEGD